MLSLLTQFQITIAIIMYLVFRILKRIIRILVSLHTHCAVSLAYNVVYKDPI